MKTYFLKAAMIFALAISFSAAASAQLRVRVRPTITVQAQTRPPRPSPRHVWVSGEWNNDHGRYAYHEGYWAAPPAHHHMYREGHWVRTRNGYYWVPGRWY